MPTPIQRREFSLVVASTKHRPSSARELNRSGCAQPRYSCGNAKLPWERSALDLSWTSRGPRRRWLVRSSAGRCWLPARIRQHGSHQVPDAPIKRHSSHWTSRSRGVVARCASPGGRCSLPPHVGNASPIKCRRPICVASSRWTSRNPRGVAGSLRLADGRRCGQQRKLPLDARRPIARRNAQSTRRRRLALPNAVLGRRFSCQQRKAPIGRPFRVANSRWTCTIHGCVIGSCAITRGHAGCCYSC
jgi:hypothetical protein